MTLDDAWKKFTQNADVSVRVTLAPTPHQTVAYALVRQQLAGRLGLCEATVLHLGMVPSASAYPSCYAALVGCIRDTIQSDPSWGDPAHLMDTIDQYFGWVQAAATRGQLSGLHLDALAALGWLGRATFFLAGGCADLANEAGSHMLDAVARVMLRTGHMHSSLQMAARALRVG